MECIVCNHRTKFFFNKKWDFPFRLLLDNADFFKCENCGFTFSKTIFELEIERWGKMNIDFHSYIENQQNPKQGNQPPYLEQATLVNILGKTGLIDLTDMIDYGGGIGTFSAILKKYFNIQMPIYEPYMSQYSNNKIEYIEKEDIGKKKVVFSSALFEHITKREQIDEINNCVADDGVLLLHTVVCENIPNDSNWFYINPPVHCALFTNKSMELLMKQWNYNSSIYCPSAKSWLMFKNDDKTIMEIVEKLNKELQTNYLFYKKGFMDYWKGF